MAWLLSLWSNRFRIARFGASVLLQSKFKYLNVAITYLFFAAAVSSFSDEVLKVFFRLFAKFRLFRLYNPVIRFQALPPSSTIVLASKFPSIKSMSPSLRLELCGPSSSDSKECEPISSTPFSL